MAADGGAGAQACQRGLPIEVRHDKAPKPFAGMRGPDQQTDERAARGRQLQQRIGRQRILNKQAIGHEAARAKHGREIGSAKPMGMEIRQVWLGHGLDNTLQRVEIVKTPWTLLQREQMMNQSACQPYALAWLFLSKRCLQVLS